ncbi:MAG: PIN domain-containing protein [Acidobacteria bacterium]|nr:PIN domain-containing protein [Acidobacteriota bacterium]
MTNLDDALAGVSSLGLDTSPFIYFIEAHPQYDAVVTEVFRRIAGNVYSGVTSVITLCEVLVHPLLRGNSRLQSEYQDLLLNSVNLRTLPIDSDIAERAAALRASYGIRTPDALQIAAAVSSGCEAFLTNDATLRRVTEISILSLDDLQFTPRQSTTPATP